MQPTKLLPDVLHSATSAAFWNAVVAHCASVGGASVRYRGLSGEPGAVADLSARYTAVVRVDGWM